MIERAFFALLLLGCLATTSTGLYQARKWHTQESVTFEVRNSRLVIDSRRSVSLLPSLHVELAAQADGAPTISRQVELPRDEVGLGFGLLAKFAPGTTVSLRQTRGNPEEIFFTATEAREPLEFAIAMGALTWLFGFLLLVVRVLRGPQLRGRDAKSRTGSGAYLLFLSVGLLALTVGLGAGVYRSWQANFWEVVIAKRVEVPSDSLPVSQVVVEVLAKQRFAESPVAWTEYEREGKFHRLPAAACLVVPCVLLVNPYDPEDWNPPFDGDSDAWAPTWIGLFFGCVFTGAGWLIRKMGI